MFYLLLILEIKKKIRPSIHPFQDNRCVMIYRVNWEYLYHAPKHRFLYCKVPKSGSSTWVVNLLKLAGIPEQTLDTDIGLHKIIRDYYPR